MDKRIPKRLFARIHTEYGSDELDSRGVVLNLSSEGVFVSGRVVTKPQQPIAIRLHPDNVAPIDVQGRMRWAQRSPPRLRGIVREGMGIQLLSPSAAYLDYFKTLTDSFARAEPRAGTMLQLRFRSRDEFVQQYTENISAGGLFITTDQVIERNTVVEIAMFVPDLAREISVKGRVVYSLDEAAAARFGYAKGIGIQIVELGEADRGLLDEYMAKIVRRRDAKPRDNSRG